MSSTLADEECECGIVEVVMVKRKGLSVRQKKLVEQIPFIIDGSKTKKQAILDAGYSENSSREQTTILGSPGIETAMQKALRKVGFDETTIADKIKEGLNAHRVFPMGSGESVYLESAPDYDAQHKFLVTGTKLLNVMPTDKVELNFSSLSDAELDAKITALQRALEAKADA